MQFAGWACLQAIDRVQISSTCSHSAPRMERHFSQWIAGTSDAHISFSPIPLNLVIWPSPKSVGPQKPWPLQWGEEKEEYR